MPTLTTCPTCNAATFDTAAHECSPHAAERERARRLRLLSETAAELRLHRADAGADPREDQLLVERFGELADSLARGVVEPD